MATLVFTNNRFIYRCTFDERATPKAAGFHWDTVFKQWYTDDTAVAFKLREFSDESARTKINQTMIQIEPWLKPLQQLPPHLELMEHQVAAILFALSRNRCYLGLDPGLGKTIVAARIAAELEARVIYICPPFLVQNVKAEFYKWAPEVEITILPDLMLHKVLVAEKYIDVTKSILIVDEAHRFKNETAKRTKAMFEISKHFARQIFMSGTPMPNRPIELYGILSKVAPETISFMNKFQYGRRYCAAHRNDFGWDSTGASNVPELAHHVVAPSGPFMLRQKKELLDLPPKIEELFVISDNMSPRLATMNGGLQKKYDASEDGIKAMLALAVGKSSDDLHVATYRRLLGEEKVEATVEYIKSLMEETDESIIVFAYHKEVIRKLNERLVEFSPYKITGETPVGDRQSIVKAFQEGNCRIIIGNYQAMGVGFTLTKATRALFLEFSWTPGENQQASDRLHRIGQKNSVLVQYIVYQDSIDKAVIETLLRKGKSIQHV